MAACGAEGVAGGDDAGPIDLAAFDGFLQGDVGPVAGADIANGGEAGFERLFRVGDGDDGPVGVGELQAGKASGFGVAVEVGVHVDQAGEKGDAGELDHFGS